LNIIVATDKNRGIGRDGQLLFRIPEDMRHFRRVTEGKIVVMGRKTYESLPGGGPLKGRLNIVLSSDRSFATKDAIICRSLKELFEKLKQFEPDDVFVLGGQKVYEELLPYCKYAYVTEYDAAFAADRQFPDIRHTAGWALAETLQQGTHDARDYSIVLFENAEAKSIF
jgi:dihydrofolate reductase